MEYLTSTKRAILQARIDKIDLQIEKLETAFDSQLENIGVEEFRFDSGDGSQKTTRRNPLDSQKLLETLYSRRDRLQRTLDGTGVISLGFRR